MVINASSWKYLYTCGTKSKQMEVKIAILQPFFDSPNEDFHIREVAKITEINHTTVRKYLQEFAKESILTVKEDKLYDSYQANIKSQAYINIKLFALLEKLRNSGLFEKMNECYMDYSAVFYEYSFALDKKEDPIRLCIILKDKKDEKKELHTKEIEKVLGRELKIILLTEKQFAALRKNESELLKEIYNGIALHGKMPVA